MNTIESAHPAIRPLPSLWLAIVAAVMLLMPLRAADAILPVDTVCSPSTVVLAAVASGNSMSVHTDLPFSRVDRTEPVTLNGLQARFLKSDNRGNLVAKFDLVAIRALLEPPTTTLVLLGVTLDGQVFSGSDTVRVLD